MAYAPIDIKSKLALFSDHWAPKIIAQMNDTQFKLVKFQGDFTWHRHNETDEVFIVFEGEMVIDFRDGAVALKSGEMFVVPKGLEHKPYAEKECHVMLVEPSGTVNTGDAGGKMTAERRMAKAMTTAKKPSNNLFMLPPLYDYELCLRGTCGHCFAITSFRRCD